MKFVKIGNTYYNTATIAWVSSEVIEGETKYFVQFLGGNCQEITEEEYYDILGINRRGIINE